MQIHGREIKFRRTVMGNCKIADASPGGDIGRLDELLNAEYGTAQRAAALFMAALSEGYEMNQHYEDPNYTMRPLTEEEALLLDSDEFNALFAEALGAFVADGKQTVEAEPVKKTADEKPA